ncbi:MAG: adenylate cyclase [Glaciecola sp.]
MTSSNRSGAARRHASVERQVRWVTVLTTVGSNLVGGVLVFVLLVWVIPRPPVDDPPPTWLVLVLACSYAAVSTPLFTAWALRRSRPGRRWLHEDRAPTSDEQRALLRMPLHVLLAVGMAWLGAAACFGTWAIVTTSLEFGVTVTVTVLLAGLTTAVVGYLQAERVLRPAASIALAASPLHRPALPGVTWRIMIAWAVGSGVPALGIMLASVSALVQEDFTRDQLAVFGLSMAAIGLFVGFVATIFAARVTAAPVEAVRRALADVQAGDFSRRVGVHDGTEMGMLQSGFNRMAAGLEERERIRAVFGQHVGVEVARNALGEAGTDLGGVQLEAGALFVDVIGSSALASELPAPVVVDLLNTFFGVVVEVAHRHGGLVNKFEGDGALVVFGAPVSTADPAGDALATARELMARLCADAPRTPAAIGVSFGLVVAGNVGSAERLEYTVLGDAVNEAARLTELAKTRTGRVAASAATVHAAAKSEAVLWNLGEPVALRGRHEPTVVAEPAESSGASSVA